MTAGTHRRGRSIQAQDRQLERLRAQVAPRRIMRVPWGWDCYTPGKEDDIYAPTLTELEARLAEPELTLFDLEARSAAARKRGPS